MPSVRRPPPLPALLFWAVAALGSLLVAAVAVAPVLDPGAAPPEGSARALALFAHDPAVRRTAAASGVGLVVTAWIFFRPPARAARARQPRPPAPQAPIVGA